MKKRRVVIFRNILILYLIFLWLIAPVYGRENNIFGIHLATPSKEDLESSAKLVNSNGGNWGYVTLVIQENDRNVKKWQEVFDRMRELRLIPIIRVATKPITDYWRKPNAEEAEGWAHFLNSLPWVTKERYIVLFNEPNHSQEWGGQINPEDYAYVTYEFIQALKKKNSDFFIMLAGFDMAAASNGKDEDAVTYIRRVFAEEKRLKDSLDGWVSHSYPNPGFQGSPYDLGRTTIRGYQWELSLLKELGVQKELPVFITETGWKHYGADSPVLADYFRNAFEIWSSDDRVRAVTPFILNYQGSPFLDFSWQKKDIPDFYHHYYEVQLMPKIFGNPVQIQGGTLKIELPHDLLTHSTYHFQIPIKNTGQAVWDKDDRYELRVTGDELEPPNHFFADLDSIKPNSEGEVDFFVKTGGIQGSQRAHIALYKGDERILDGGDWWFQILPLPSIEAQVDLFPRLRAKKERDFELQLFDEREQLVYKQKGLKRSDGKIVLDAVRNVYIGGTYRAVVLSEYYLPRQTFIQFQKGKNKTVFEPMLPLDFNVDGAFTWKDILAFLKKPSLLGLFLP